MFPHLVGEKIIATNFLFSKQSEKNNKRMIETQWSYIPQRLDLFILTKLSTFLFWMDNQSSRSDEREGNNNIRNLRERQIEIKKTK